ncbi:MAG: ABC transporter ATP-binding protein [Actinobacteria bacterium]|nr:ABC transporter ATP-binding protein [Actinomycetota bacterium]
MENALECRNLRKQYPGQSSYALGDADRGVSVDVKQGELFALLGPSGCGKTTTLRIVGGFAEPDDGEVVINGEEVTSLPPYGRRTNTVFQSYALFPHMRVGANVGFGLKMGGVGKAEREARVRAVLEQVGLADFERRRVTELSGGQQQRAALARAMVNEPAILLLDEPLGALDLKLRREMQDELVRLKGRTKMTFVHVTHDQEEACAIADRIAIMDRGHIIQVDTPVALYREPRTSYVAEFINIGTVVRGRAQRSADWIEVEGENVRIEGRPPAWLNGHADVAAVLPHSRARIDPSDADEIAGSCGMVGVIDRVTFTGSVFEIVARTEEGFEVRAEMSEDDTSSWIRPGTSARIWWPNKDILFVKDSNAGTSGQQRWTTEV